ncbi:MAG: hypothetical protein RL017_544 [Pseudomonadota bacterium]|jgi:citrate synthase
MVQERIRNVVANTFKINLEDITDRLEYQSIAAWDSLNHISLMLALEEEFKIKIDENMVLHLSSISKIYQFMQSANGNVTQCTAQPPNLKTQNNEPQQKLDNQPIHRGLNGIYYDYSSICNIDGKNGKLYYRGINIQDLLEKYKFEDIIGLLIFKKPLFDKDKLELCNKLNAHTQLPNDVINILSSVKHLQPFNAIRAALSFMVEKYFINYSDIGDLALTLLNFLPLLVGQFNLLRNGSTDKLIINPNWSYAKNVLFFLSGKEPQDIEVEYFDKDLILHAEHDSNASTFTARICSSTKANPIDSILAAMSAFTGELHGGALNMVSKMLAEIEEPQNVEAYIKRRLEQKLPIYGYGHRIYRTLDPRAAYMDKVALALSKLRNNYNDYNILQNINKCMKRYSDLGIAPNVDFYDAVIYKLLDIPEDLFLMAFIISRAAGWLAHIQEQLENNILIRPKLKYKN